MYTYIIINIHHSRKQVRVKMRFLVLPCLGVFCILLLSLDRYVRWGVTIHDEIGKVAINSILSIHGIPFFPRDSSSTPMGFGRFRNHKAKRNNGFQPIWYLPWFCHRWSTDSDLTPKRFKKVAPLRVYCYDWCPCLLLLDLWMFMVFIRPTVFVDMHQQFHWLDLSRLESFRVALHAELLLDAGSGSNSISNASGQRRSALCERAMKLASPVPSPARSAPKPHHSKMKGL